MGGSTFVRKELIEFAFWTFAQRRKRPVRSREVRKKKIHEMEKKTAENLL